MESSTEKSSEDLQNNPNHILYISNIPKTAKKQQLYQLLLPFGHVNSLNIIYRGEFAFAFAQFDDMRDAAAAVKDLNQTIFNKRKLRVEFKNKKQNSAQILVQKKQKSNSYSQRNCKEEKQCETQISLGLQGQLTSRKDIRQSVGKKEYSRERSRQKRHGRESHYRSHRYDSGTDEVRNRYCNGERENRNDRRKKIEIVSEELDEIVEDLLFVESRISRIYEKLDRLIYAGKKERSHHRDSH